MAYEIQLKLMVGKGKHLTPCQFNVRAHMCAFIHGLRKVGACFLHAYKPVTPPRCSGKEAAPSCSNLANTSVSQHPRLLLPVRTFNTKSIISALPPSQPARLGAHIHAAAASPPLGRWEHRRLPLCLQAQITSVQSPSLMSNRGKLLTGPCFSINSKISFCRVFSQLSRRGKERQYYSRTGKKNVSRYNLLTVIFLLVQPSEMRPPNWFPF